MAGAVHWLPTVHGSYARTFDVRTRPSRDEAKPKRYRANARCTARHASAEPNRIPLCQAGKGEHHRRSSTQLPPPRAVRRASSLSRVPIRHTGPVVRRARNQGSRPRRSERRHLDIRRSNPELGDHSDKETTADDCLERYCFRYQIAPPRRRSARVNGPAGGRPARRASSESRARGTRSSGSRSTLPQA